MRKSKSIIVILSMVLLLASIIPAVASADTKNYTVAGSQMQAVIITVKTNKATTLTLSQTKGVYSYSYLHGMNDKTVSTYGAYFVYVQDLSGKEAPKTYSLIVAKSTSIKLSANKTYQITVCAESRTTTYNRLVAKNVLKLKSYFSSASNSSWIEYTNWKAVIANASSASARYYTAPQQ